MASDWNHEVRKGEQVPLRLRDAGFKARAERDDGGHIGRGADKPRSWMVVGTSTAAVKRNPPNLQSLQERIMHAKNLSMRMEELFRKEQQLMEERRRTPHFCL